MSMFDSSAATKLPESTRVPMDGGRSRNKSANIHAGQQLGRYVVLSRLGAGAMGVVFAAYDPELDRKVAIKLLRSEQSRQAIARSRLQREARALAKLAHPNVVGVHDVGTHEGDVFVAMEFVDGTTLAQWREAEHPTWREVVRVFCQLGRGLQAAHEVGLVHRDIKPENLMLDGRGVARVMDFGLARACEPDSVSMRAHNPVKGLCLSDAPEPSLTRTGAIVGTPAYMAPEQLEQRGSDASSDQFSFCVALYEALYGQRPFAGNTMAQLTQRLLAAEVRPPPADTKVPPWIHRIVQRGLAIDRNERWPSIAELVAALASDPSRRRRTWARWGASALLLASSTLGLAWMLNDADPVCEHMDRHLQGVWDDSARMSVQQSLLDTGVHDAETTARFVTEQLDSTAAAWVDARTHACKATWLHGEQSETLLDQRMACFDRGLGDLAALVRVLSKADAKLAHRAVSASAGLDLVEPCTRGEEHMAMFDGPAPRDAPQARQLELRLSEVGAMVLAGRYHEGLELAEHTERAARTFGYAPLHAEALRHLGNLRQLTGDYAGSEQASHEAYSIATVAGYDREAIQSAMNLAFTLGYLQTRRSEARVWGTQAELLARSRDSPAELGESLNVLALVSSAAGEYDEAIALHERAIEQRHLEGNALSMANSYNNIGVAAYHSGDLKKAESYYRKALRIREEELGADHPLVAEVFNNIAGVATSTGDDDGALEGLRRSLEIRTQALGPEHPDVAASHDNIGLVQLRRGELEAATEHIQRARAIFEATLGPDHPELALTHIHLAQIARSRGRRDDAIEHFEAALRIRRKAFDEGHIAVVDSLRELVDAHLHWGEIAAANARTRRATESSRASLGPANPTTALFELMQGDVMLAEGRVADAIPLIEQALSTLDQDDNTRPQDRADAEYTLARALWAVTPRQTARATALAESARRRLVAIGSPDAEDVGHWLEHRRH